MSVDAKLAAYLKSNPIGETRKAKLGMSPADRLFKVATIVARALLKDEHLSQAMLANQASLKPHDVRVLCGTGYGGKGGLELAFYKDGDKLTLANCWENAMRCVEKLPKGKLDAFLAALNLTLDDYIEGAEGLPKLADLLAQQAVDDAATIQDLLANEEVA
jgi:hypothetical protein